VQSNSNIAWLVLRLIFHLYALPFTSIANVVVIFTKWKSLADHSFVRVVKLTVTIVMGVAFLLFVGFAIFIYGIFSPRIVSTLSDYPGSEYHVTSQPVASVCNVTVRGWSLEELAAVVAAAQSVDYPDVYQRILKTVLFKWDARPFLGNPQLFGMLVTKSDSPQAVLGFEGIRTGRHVGIVLETVLCYWYPFLMGAIVPFFTIVNQFFLAPILNAYSMALSSDALGLVPVSESCLAVARS
jgi:hypothetical protein